MQKQAKTFKYYNEAANIKISKIESFGSNIRTLMYQK
jgi:hypothetical protein